MTYLFNKLEIHKRGPCLNIERSFLLESFQASKCISLGKNTKQVGNQEMASFMLHN